MLTVLIVLTFALLVLRPMSVAIDSLGQWLTGVGSFAAGLFDYQNQREAAKRAEAAQQEAIQAAYTAQRTSADIGRGIADRQYRRNQGSINQWEAKTDRAIDNWFRDYAKRGGVQGQIQPGLDKLSADTRTRVSDTESTATKRADAALSEQAAQQEADRERVFADSAELKKRVSDSIQFGRSTFKELRDKFAQDVAETVAGGQAVMDFLKKGVSEQISGAVSSTRTDKTNALAELEATWQGPRDDKYFAAKQAIESQYENAKEKTLNERQEGFNVVAADTLTKVNDTTASVRSSAQAAEGQAFYGLTSSEAEHARTLGINAGDVASFLGTQEKIRGDLQGSLETSLNSLRETNSNILKDTDTFISSSVQSAITTDEATRATYSDLKRQTADAELAARSNAEATYSNWLFGALDRSSAFAQLGINLTFAQNFGVPLLAPTFQNFFNNLDTYRNTQLTERQVTNNERQTDLDAIFGGLGLGVQAATPFLGGGGTRGASTGGRPGIPGLSDVNAKHDFKTVNHQDILEKVQRLPITSWRYRSLQVEPRHIGPMAQDFHGLFGFGGDDRYIDLMDELGVALACIKALTDRVEQLEKSHG